MEVNGHLLEKNKNPALLKNKQKIKIKPLLIFGMSKSVIKGQSYFNPQLRFIRKMAQCLCYFHVICDFVFAYGLLHCKNHRNLYLFVSYFILLFQF